MINFFFKPHFCLHNIFVNCYLSPSKPEMKNVLKDLHISFPKMKITFKTLQGKGEKENLLFDGEF